MTRFPLLLACLLLAIPSGCEEETAHAASSTETDEPSRVPNPGDEAEETEEPNATATEEGTEDEDARAPGPSFLGEPDAPRLHALATEDVVEIEKGRGGRSLAFEITLADGTKGYYKPEQSFSAAHWYAEVASYYLDRELGLGRAIPTIGRALPWAPLRAAAGGDERLDEVTVQEDGTVRGAFIWWVDGGLDPIDPGRNWDSWIRVEGPLAVTPYQRPREWSSGTVRDEADDAPERAPDHPDRPAELSDMILFDYLTTNVDRWGGRFTNVRTRGEGGPLVYLDNGAGFTAGPTARIPLMDARLHGLQRFRRRTVEAIRRLSMDDLRERMAEDPLAPVLTDRHYEQLEARRRHLLEHVEDMEERFGDQVWLDGNEVDTAAATKRQGG